MWTAFTGGGGGAVSSVAAADGTLTITPTTGSVTAKIPTNVALPGAPTTTTATALSNSTKIATTAYTDAAVAASRFLTTQGVQTANFNALGNSFYPLDTTSGAIHGHALPNAPVRRARIIGLKIVASATPTNVVTVAAQGSDVLNVAGTTTATIKVSGEAQTWVYNAATTTWYAQASTPVGQLDLRYATRGFATAMAVATRIGARWPSSFIKNYSFVASTHTITCTDFSGGQPLVKERLELIYDVTLGGAELYNFADTTSTAAIASNNQIVLTPGTGFPAGTGNSDKLLIIYDTQPGDPGTTARTCLWPTPPPKHPWPSWPSPSSTRGSAPAGHSWQARPE